MSEPIKWSAFTSEQRDALIAERVIGWVPQECDGSISWDHGIWRCLECGTDGTRHETTMHTIPVPCYTASLDAIKSLRLHMAERFPLLNLHLIVYAYNRCYAAFTDNVDEREWSEGNGEHCMEDAICMTALRVCGIEVQL